MNHGCLPVCVCVSKSYIHTYRNTRRSSIWATSGRFSSLHRVHTYTHACIHIETRDGHPCVDHAGHVSSLFITLSYVLMRSPTCEQPTHPNRTHADNNVSARPSRTADEGGRLRANKQSGQDLCPMYNGEIRRQHHGGEGMLCLSLCRKLGKM